jgi:hypothetical protein
VTGPIRWSSEPVKGTLWDHKVYLPNRRLPFLSDFNNLGNFGL